MKEAEPSRLARVFPSCVGLHSPQGANSMSLFKESGRYRNCEDLLQLR